MYFRLLFSLAFLLCLSACDTQRWQPIKAVEWTPEVLDQDLNLQSYTDDKSGLMGYKTMEGDIIIPARFKMAHEFNKYGIARVWKGPSKTDKKSHDNWYFMDRLGSLLMKSYFFDNAGDYFVSGLSRYVDKGKVGFVNHKAEIVIKAAYDWAGIFAHSAPIAIVCKGCQETPVKDNRGKNSSHTYRKGGKWGAIDKSGRLVISLEYDSYPSSQFKKGDKCYTPLWNGKDKYKVEEAECVKK